ncbi:MAG: response regulator [Pirellulaceae bacterium]|jgi:two-component system, OmpR family, phosphate regulon response regulator PhoB|nr:response regulator [Pirellulaceae bacterium]
MRTTKVLLVEDDRPLAEIIEYNLNANGFEVIRSSDGQDALNQVHQRNPDIILLDLMIPVIDGLEVCRRLRASVETASIPILILTAKSEEVDQIVGYRVGADDYVTKPFSVRVLMERIKSLLRRQQPTNSNLVTVPRSGIVVDRLKHMVMLDEQPIDLTPSEFRLLDTLIRQPGRAFDRMELIDSALGSDTVVLDRTIDVHIRSLRKKLGGKADFIQTVRGVGYRFQDPNTI